METTSGPRGPIQHTRGWSYAGDRVLAGLTGFEQHVTDLPCKIKAHSAHSQRFSSWTRIHFKLKFLFFYNRYRLKAALEFSQSQQQKENFTEDDGTMNIANLEEDDDYCAADEKAEGYGDDAEHSDAVCEEII